MKKSTKIIIAIVLGLLLGIATADFIAQRQPSQQEAVHVDPNFPEY